MGVGLVVCVIPNTRLDRYVAVKRHVCMVMAVPSQVCSKVIEDDGREDFETKEVIDIDWCYFYLITMSYYLLLVLIFYLTTIDSHCAPTAPANLFLIPLCSYFAPLSFSK